MLTDSPACHNSPAKRRGIDQETAVPRGPPDTLRALPASEAHDQASAAPIAVAVVSWNTRELLDRCLRSLHADAGDGLADVWVVDNGSSDGSRELIEQQHPWARLISADENLGFGRAVNLVGRRCGAAWIAPANADVELHPGALRALLAAGEADPGAGALGPRLILPDGSTQPSVQPFPTLTNVALLHLHAHLVSGAAARRLALPQHWDPAHEDRVDWVTGALMLVRRSAWDSVGGFDEDQWMYAEDLDLCWRLARAGWATRYVPAALVAHALSAAAEQAFGEQMSERWMAAVYAWMLRRRGMPITWLTALANAAEASTRLAVLTLLAYVDPDRWDPARRQARATLAVHRLGLRRPAALRRAR